MSYSPLSHVSDILWKRRPIHLTFFLTKRCNSKCPFCFYLKSTDDQAESNELTLDEIGRISSSMGKLLWLAFSGGEIHLRKDLFEISKVFYDNNRPSIMLFPTNGMLPELISERMERILQYCEKSVVAVKLSLDGLNGAHDRVRNTPGSFENTIRTYHRLEGLLEKYPNFELGINTVFCSENQDDMDGIIDFVSGLENIKTHTISLVRGNLSDTSYKNVYLEKYYHAIDRLEKNQKDRTARVYRFKGAKIKAAQDIVQRRLIHQTRMENKWLIPCYAGRLNLVLTENGDVFPCEILTKSFGNVRDYGLDMARVARTDKALKIINDIRSNKCFCTHECNFMINILFNPMMYPALLKEYRQI